MNATDRDRDDLGLPSEQESRLAAGALGPDDFALLNSIRAVWDEHDPVPDGLVERIQFELTLDALNAEVATLIQLDLATSGARSAGTEEVRTVTFTSESLSTMVTLTPQPDGTVRVDGWCAPGGEDPVEGLRVEVLLASTTLETSADEDGRFVFESVPTGMAKFALHQGEHTVLSPTIEL